MQCYADEPGRRDLPEYWFVTNKGNLISVYSGKPKWIKKDVRESGRGKYVFTILKNGIIVRKSIEVHNLVALVFGSNIYGKAKDLLKEKGVYSFGIRSKEEIHNNGHHIDGDKENNSPDNIQILTTDVHQLIESMPCSSEPEDVHLAWSLKASNVLSDEEPDKITVCYGGEYTVDGVAYRDKERSIHAVESLKFSPRAAMQLKEIVQAIYGLKNENMRQNSGDIHTDDINVG